MSQIEKSIAQFVANGKPIDGKIPDVRVEVLSAKIDSITDSGKAKNIVFTIEGEKYSHNGYIGANELTYQLLQKSYDLDKKVIVRLERQRKKDEDPEISIKELTKDMNTAREHAIKLTVGIYDENNQKWILTNEAASNPDEDPASVKSGIDSVNYDEETFFATKKTKPATLNNREFNAKSDSLLTLYFFIKERALKSEANIDDKQIKEYAELLLVSCEYIQKGLFKLKEPVYSDYSFTRTRYLLFNYTDHIQELDKNILEDINQFKSWAKTFMKNGMLIWDWALQKSK